MGLNLGLVGSLEWVNSYSRKQCRNLFWRVRTAVKKAVKNGAKKPSKFQYDPSSYALNFDDGSCHLGLGANVAKQPKVQDYSESKKLVGLCYLGGISVMYCVCESRLCLVSCTHLRVSSWCHFNSIKE